MKDFFKALSIGIGKLLVVIGVISVFVTVNYLIYELFFTSWPVSIIFWSIELVIIGGIIDDM